MFPLQARRGRRAASRAARCRPRRCWTCRRPTTSRASRTTSTRSSPAQVRAFLDTSYLEINIFVSRTCAAAARGYASRALPTSFAFCHCPACALALAAVQVRLSSLSPRPGPVADVLHPRLVPAGAPRPCRAALLQNLKPVCSDAHGNSSYMHTLHSRW